MAKYLGLISSDARGKLGGTVLTRGGNGTNLRRHAAGTQPRSSVQMTNRAMQASVAQQWRLLSGPDQISWIILASNTNLTNTLGQLYSPSGQQLFILCNRTVRAFGSGFLHTAPSTFSPIAPVSSIGLTVTTTDVIVSASGTVSGHTPAVNFFLSGPLSQGIYYISKSQTKFMTNWQMNAGDIYITDQYLAAYGVLPKRCNIHIYCTPFISNEGFPGATTRAKFQVT